MKIVVLFLALSLRVASSAVPGMWDATITVNGVAVPFRLGVNATAGTAHGWFYNGDEKTVSTRGTLQAGILDLYFDQYASHLHAELKNTTFEGYYDRARYPRFLVSAKRHVAVPADPKAPDISGEWNIATPDNKSEKAWHFKVASKAGSVSGSILRVDGDTGLLTGTYTHGKYVMSHFSGARPLLLEVTPLPEGTLKVVQNGKSEYLATRSAVAVSKGMAQPADTFHYTTMKNPEEAFRFRFPDLNGRSISNTDPQFRGKVVLVAVGGSWCPNCHDEAPLLESLYKKYKSRGFEVVGLSFEEEEQLKDPSRVRAFVKQYGLTYTTLLAGKTEDVNILLPQAENLVNWPTTFILGRDGRVRGVHAGFAGTVTGSFHTSQNQEITALIEKLLAEQ